MPDRRVALVTGAAHGIGLATAERLLREGWHVVIADRAEEAPSTPARPRISSRAG